MYNVKKAFCLVTTGNALYTYSNGVVDLLYGTIDNHKDLSNFNELGCFKNEQAINLTTIQVPTEIKDANPLYGATISSSYGLLEVPFVANHSHPVSGYSGLCWSAAIASIGAFRNDVTPLSALDRYFV